MERFKDELIKKNQSLVSLNFLMAELQEKTPEESENDLNDPNQVMDGSIQEEKFATSNHYSNNMFSTFKHHKYISRIVDLGKCKLSDLM